MDEPDLESWLDTIGLSQYSEAIQEYGYTNLSVLLAADEEDIAEFAADPEIKMKKPSQKAFLKAFKKLKADEDA